MTTLSGTLCEEGAVKLRAPNQEQFTLKSGKKSRLFFDVKEASLNPKVLRKIVNEIYYMIFPLAMIGKDNIANPSVNKFGSIAIGTTPNNCPSRKTLYWNTVKNYWRC